MSNLCYLVFGPHLMPGGNRWEVRVFMGVPPLSSGRVLTQLDPPGKMWLISPFHFLLVIDGLDFLKKENAGARDSIRYLEAEFKKGNR